MKLLIFALALSIACTSAYAQQQPAPKIVTLHKSPVSGQPDKEFLLLSIEWPAGARTPAHTHLGDEYGSVIEGSYSVRCCRAAGSVTYRERAKLPKPDGAHRRRLSRRAGD